MMTFLSVLCFIAGALVIFVTAYAIMLHRSNAKIKRMEKKYWEQVQRSKKIVEKIEEVKNKNESYR